jgi:type III restriction enzyme
MAYLYSIFDNPFARRALEQVVLPNYIADNLKYSIRPYQEEAFKRYIYLDKEDFEEKPKKPYHLLYNMATGSGKTMVMAGLMLYLYEKGYRNFLFFVNSNNIIKKTKDNFLNPQASKYLFNNKLVVDGREVLIKEVENFEEADTENINIKFTTIQQLHIDLNNTKENSVTFEDFENREIVLIADEAHHLSSGTKKGALFGSWEDTVQKVHQCNFNNILLEFTATLDYESREIAEKYKDKVIHKYDLAQFRLDKYSKEINLVRSLYEEKERIIQALILNLYRQELATSNNINLKPVILFKAKRTIKESEQNKANFHQIVEEFSAEMVENIQQTSTVPIVQKAFQFFRGRGILSSEIAKRIKANFKEENCISANNDKEAEKNQILLNTLEDENNPIRAVFAVQKLNEGWDVLNLFDIVRLYEGQNTGGNNRGIGNTTISEAQLIGRGARYFPFKLEEGQDLFTRKFDDDVSNDLKILEELYYHTKEDSRYISELKQALIDTGIYEDDENTVQLPLLIKTNFKDTDFYKTGKVIFNKKVEKSYDNVKSFADLGVKKKNFSYTLSSGVGRMTGVFTKEEENGDTGKIEPGEVPLNNIPKHTIRFALSQNPFYYFDNLERYFPNVECLSNFIDSKDYLGGLELTFYGAKDRLEEINNQDYLLAVNGLLSAIELDIKSNMTDYEGSKYISDYIHKVFKDKEIKVRKGTVRADGQFDVVSKPEWYVYNANYGTSEEKDFVKMFARRFEHLEKKYTNIYLIRNERELKIFDNLGRRFEPDFILFCKQKEGEEMIYQVFIEPKGRHLIADDKWKNDFLQEMRQQRRTLTIDTDLYLITGVPFYNNADENEFKRTLEDELGV